MAGVVALVALTVPCAAADPIASGVLDAPTLSLTDLGSDATLSFYGETSSASVSIPVPNGLVPATLNATLNLPFDIRYGLLTVLQDDRIISKIGLPLTDSAPVAIPLDGVRVIDNSVTLTLTLNVLAGEGFCLDQLNPVQLVGASVAYRGTEVAPTTIADFLPPILRKLTIAVPSTPSVAESDTAIQLAAALVERYRDQAPQVVLVPLADGTTTPSEPAAPMERQIVIKEGPDLGLSIIPANGVPALLISGAQDKLSNQARLLTDPSLNMAVSAKAVAGELHPSTWTPGNSTSLAELRQPALTATGLAPQIGIALDQTRFGHPTQGFRVHLLGSYTPVPAAFGAQLTASVGGEVIDTWSPDAVGAIDRWVDVPGRLVGRYTSLAVAVNTSGATGRCGEFRPITLRIGGNTVVESSVAQVPMPPGFGSLPQALMPRIQLGIKESSFADTVRAAQIVVGLQRLSVIPLSTTVTSLKQAINGDDPAILISADGWNDPSIALPVSASDRQITLAGGEQGAPPTTLNLDPGIQFGSLQTVFTGKRSVLVATSNGAPNRLDDLLRWLDEDAQRWSQLKGNALVAIAGQEPALVPGRTPAGVYGPPATAAPQAAERNGNSPLALWAAAGASVAVVAGFVALRWRSRRPKSEPSAADEQQ
ncbi:hypothetical protein EAH80_11550 [Mycobacterium hodleri]|uniref:Cellulose biosynthesis cyclic di-GMP-binding regulatory protein BcsB n=2 Tax=Mycolicibacterium hodleri TaxID=49897 RepID=A0A502ECL0_9MYCO|nr:hypothetical protein EAH80_11550 [Mycolicibacterium hodleri]